MSRDLPPTSPLPILGPSKAAPRINDLAAALFNMIYENVGVMASLALGRTPPECRLTGSLANLAPAARPLTFSIRCTMSLESTISFRLIRLSPAVRALLCDPLPEN